MIKNLLAVGSFVSLKFFYTNEHILSSFEYTNKVNYVKYSWQSSQAIRYSWLDD